MLAPVLTSSEERGVPNKGLVECRCGSRIKYEKYHLMNGQVTCTVCCRLIGIKPSTLIKEL